MGFFNFPGDQDHRTFNYKPIYYDKEEEERRQKFGRVDGTFEREAKEAKEKGTYVPGSYLKGSIRDGAYQRRRAASTKAQRIIGLVGLILVAVILIYFTKFYSLL